MTPLGEIAIGAVMALGCGVLGVIFDTLRKMDWRL